MVHDSGKMNRDLCWNLLDPFVIGKHASGWGPQVLYPSKNAKAVVVVFLDSEAQ